MLNFYLFIYYFFFVGGGEREKELANYLLGYPLVDWKLCRGGGKSAAGFELEDVYECGFGEGCWYV